MTEPFGRLLLRAGFLTWSMTSKAAEPGAGTASRAMTAPASGWLPYPRGRFARRARACRRGRRAGREPAPAKRSGLRRFIVPVLILAALGYGGKTAYDYFVEGRFLVSTDDAYVGADTAIIAAKAMGHLTAVPVVDNQVVHKGDLLAAIDDGDYQNAVDAARARIGTQDATIARFARQIDAQARDHRPGARRRWLGGGAGEERRGRRRAGRARI